MVCVPSFPFSGLPSQHCSSCSVVFRVAFQHISPGLLPLAEVSKDLGDAARDALVI